MADIAAISPVAYGIEKSGKWRLVPEAEWSERVLEPNKVYEFNYRVSEVPFLLWLPWVQIFDPQRYVSELREELARKMAVSPEEIQIPWFYYNPDTRQFRVQLQYVPGGTHGEVAAIFITITAISFLILSVTMLLTMFGGIFRETPVLEMVKEMKEWMGELGVVMKYVVYALIAGGSIWLATKIIPKFKKKKAKA